MYSLQLIPAIECEACSRQTQKPVFRLGGSGDGRARTNKSDDKVGFVFLPVFLHQVGIHLACGMG